MDNLIQKAINHYIALDPEAKKKCAQLSGKIVSIELTKEPDTTNILTNNQLINFQMIFTQDVIQFKLDNFSNPDTVIRGTPFSLLHISFAKENRKRFFAEDVSITGDLDLGQDVIHLFDSLDIDWEDYLSQWVGDIPARQISNIARKLFKTTKKIGETLMQSSNEYFHEEINISPPREELEDFFCDIDKLRMDTDRLQARMEQLEALIQTMNEV